MDEEARLEQEEEDQERELSKRHGEATEAGGNSSKKRSTTTEQDIEAEYANAAARAKKKPRPTLTISQLVGPDGLIRIRREFPSQLRYPRGRSANVRQDIDAAAICSRKLVAAYQSFCYDLCPSFAFEDFLIKMDSLGSKKEVKSFLQNMRDDVRNAHVERLYGKEKAEKMIQELETGLKQQQSEILKEHFSQLESEMPRDDDEQNEANDNSPNVEESNHVNLPVAPVQHVARVNPYQGKNSLAARSRIGDSSKDEQMRPPVPTPPRNDSHQDYDEEEEEEEANFDDIQDQFDAMSSPQKVDTAAKQHGHADNRLVRSIPRYQEDVASVAPNQISVHPLKPLDDDQFDEEGEASFEDIQGKPALQQLSAAQEAQKDGIRNVEPCKHCQDEDDDEEEACFDDIQGISKEQHDEAKQMPNIQEGPLKASIHLGDDEEEANLDDVRGKSPVKCSSPKAKNAWKNENSLILSPAFLHEEKESNEVAENIPFFEPQGDRENATSSKIPLVDAIHSINQGTLVLESEEARWMIMNSCCPAMADESSSKTPLVSHSGTSPPHDASVVATYYSRPSQENDTSMMSFAQPSQEFSLMDDGPTQSSVPELATQFDEPSGNAAFTPSQAQHPTFMLQVSQDASCMDETATIVPTQGGTGMDFPFTLPTQSQSQSNHQMDQSLNDSETATIIPTMTAQSDMDESNPS